MTCDSIDPRVFISKVDQIIGDRGFYDVILFDCPSFIMFHLDDCPRARDILTHGKFEPMSMKLWCRLVKDATGILDIGAQVGVYSLAAAALRSDITIHAFEPNPDAYARLELHRRANGFGNIKTYRWPCHLLNVWCRSVGSIRDISHRVVG